MAIYYDFSQVLNFGVNSFLFDSLISDLSNVSLGYSGLYSNYLMQIT